MIDAIQILVEKGMTTAAFLPARAAFEASIYIDWILLSDSERKARSYIVANYRDERLWASRVIKAMPEEKTFDVVINGVAH